jgi:TetR/AcrR family transcriptional repressor of lmrAB and yxaGH operons
MCCRTFRPKTAPAAYGRQRPLDIRPTGLYNPVMTSSKTPATRDRLLVAMSELLQRRGFHGVGLADILAQAQAPKGVLYHHFPEGKAQLAEEAIRMAVASMIARLDRLCSETTRGVEAVQAWLANAQRQLAQSGFERGCPLATTALETTSEDERLRKALADGFGQLRAKLTEVFVASGVASERAQSLAMLFVAAYEGALMQARVAGKVEPIQETSAMLVDMLRREIEMGRAPRG